MSPNMKEKKVIGQWDTGHDFKTLMIAFEKEKIYKYNNAYQTELAGQLEETNSVNKKLSLLMQQYPWLVQE